MGQKLLFLYRICADRMYMPYLQALLSESVKLKLMFSQYESGCYRSGINTLDLIILFSKFSKYRNFKSVYFSLTLSII